VRREIVWAGVIGISFGLIIAFGVLRINSSLNKSKSGAPVATPIPQNPTAEFKIALNTPGDNDVVTTSPISVSGITKSLTWTVVSGEGRDYILQSDEKGIFAQDVDLAPGVNQIRLAAFDPGGTQSSQKVLVVYSSAFQLETVAFPTPGSTATGDAAIATGDNAIREKVAQKVAQAMSQPKAYVGVVTDIADSTIQIKTPESQIEQISIDDPNITAVNTKGKGNKQVKLTDIAIGDFIVAMGYVNGNQVLKAQRILITDPLQDSKLSASFGKVTGTTKKSLTVSDIKKGEGSTVTPDKNTSVESFTGGKTSSIKIAAIATGDLIIYITDQSGTSPTVRSIFDIGKPQG